MGDVTRDRLETLLKLATSAFPEEQTELIREALDHCEYGFAWDELRDLYRKDGAREDVRTFLAEAAALMELQDAAL